LNADNVVSNSAVTISKNTPDPLAYEFNLVVTPSVQAHAGKTGDVAVTDPMELTTVLAEAPVGVEGTNDSSDNFYFGYYPAGAASPHMRYEQIGSIDYWRLIKVNVRLNTSNLHGYTEEEAVALLDEATTNNGYTLSVSTNTYQKTADTSVNALKTYYTVSAGVWSEVETPQQAQLGTYYEKDATSRAKMVLGASDTAKPTSAYSLTTVPLQETAKIPANGGDNHYFGLYVEGSGKNDKSQDIQVEIIITATRGNVA